MKNVGHHCGWLLMVTLSWLVVIHHIIFLMITVFFWYITIEIKYCLFDMGYIPPDYSYMKTFIVFLIPFQSKTVSVFAYTNYTNFDLFLK